MFIDFQIKINSFSTMLLFVLENIRYVLNSNAHSHELTPLDISNIILSMDKYIVIT